MNEETTTTPVEGAEAQPLENEVAVETQQTAEEQPAELPKPSLDDNLEWLKNKGIDPDSKEAITAVAEKWREAERQMHKKTADKGLERTIDTANKQQIADAAATGTDAAEIALARVQAMEVTNSVNSFFIHNPEAKQHEDAMAALVTQRPQLRQMINSGMLGIEDLYAMTVGSNLDSVKAEGGKQALQQLANKQAASAVPGAATTSATAPKKSDAIMDLWAD